MMLSCVILVTRYWRAQGERESCLGTLDQHVVRMREMKEEAGEERADLQSQIREQETELENFKREKVIILYPLDNTIYGYIGPRGRDGEAGAGGRGGGGREGEDQERRPPGG